MASNPIIDQLEKEQIRTDIPEFNPGDTVRVEVKVVRRRQEPFYRLLRATLSLSVTVA